MKPGEKRAFLAIFIAIAAIIAFTVYYEVLYQKREAAKQAETLANADVSNTDLMLAMNVIPKGLNPNALPDSDGRGATMLILYCVQCHDLPSPSMHTATEWDQVLQRMQERMRARRGGVLVRVMMPPEKDWGELKAYLHQYAQRPLEPASLSDLESPAGQAFQNTCSQCHAAPDPAQHTASEWPRVVLRMKSNMQTAGKTPPTENNIELIVNYLQLHSKDKNT
ncbi:hypothetical protein [Kaarinaea lacus]